MDTNRCTYKKGRVTLSLWLSAVGKIAVLFVLPLKAAESTVGLPTTKRKEQAAQFA